jgi:hypothetical protein
MAPRTHWQVTSLFLHLMPACVSWALRWWPPDDMRHAYTCGRRCSGLSVCRRSSSASSLCLLLVLSTNSTNCCPSMWLLGQCGMRASQGCAASLICSLHAEDKRSRFEQPCPKLLPSKRVLLCCLVAVQRGRGWSGTPCAVASRLLCCMGACWVASSLEQEEWRRQGGGGRVCVRL